MCAVRLANPKRITISDHLYELVYDPRNALDANAAEHGIDCSRCTAIMYVDGVNMGHYYPYTFSEAAIGGEESASITWGSGSSGGQAHLRWNWVEFSILTPECKRPYFSADAVPADAMVFREPFATVCDHVAAV